MADDAKPFWATVDETDPLAVRKDGETEPIAATPDSLVDPYHLRNGDRVRCTLHHKRVQILGKSGGGAPLIRWGELKIEPKDESGDYYKAHKTILLSGFTEKPNIQLAVNSSVADKVEVGWHDRTTTKFEITLYRTNTTETNITWLAMGY